jgi:hypothetical protein
MLVVTKAYKDTVTVYVKIEKEKKYNYKFNCKQSQGENLMSNLTTSKYRPTHKKMTAGQKNRRTKNTKKYVKT